MSEPLLNVELPDAGRNILETQFEGGRWFVAHTRSRNEKMLARELNCLHIVNYLPLTQRVSRSPTSRRLFRSLVPVFPGYVFFYATEEQRYAALRTNRIANILQVPNQEQLRAELSHIQFLLTHTDAFEVSDRLKAGDWGRVRSGPLAGVEGVVSHVSGRYRLTMNVTILGQGISVELDRDNVEPIEAPKYLTAANTGR